jgi:hypothetical protein
VTNVFRGAVAMVAACACLSAGAQTLYKCVQKDGKVHYQDSKCTEDAKESTLQKLGPPGEPGPPPPDPVAIGTAKAAAVKNRAADIDAVMDIIASYDGCAQAFPSFASKFGSAYQAYRTRNAAAVASYEQDPEAPAKVAKRVAEQKNELVGDAAALRCDKTIGPMIMRAGNR